jgi:hypothetical protein
MKTKVKMILKDRGLVCPACGLTTSVYDKSGKINMDWKSQRK